MSVSLWREKCSSVHSIVLGESVVGINLTLSAYIGKAELGSPNRFAIAKAVVTKPTVDIGSNMRR